MFGTVLFAIILLAVQARFEISAYASLQMPIQFHAALMSAILLASVVLILLLLALLLLSFRRPQT